MSHPTPGRWVVRPNGDIGTHPDDVWASADIPYVIVHDLHVKGRNLEEREANKRLLAAAKEYYASAGAFCQQGKDMLAVLEGAGRHDLALVLEVTLKDFAELHHRVEGGP